MSERRLHGKHLLVLELHAAQTHVAAPLFSLAVDAVEDAVLVATVKKYLADSYEAEFRSTNIPWADIETTPGNFSDVTKFQPNVSLHRADTLSRDEPYKLGGMLSATFLQFRSRTSV
ncbi:hypothetical protein C8F04DRAFT_1197756 [Mycena alexandri]|uniref:Uncharacterized protein n=1 Tax=Mycena alexandri TaxID=1745969 RepID=A0AAD6S352_9AGAR|nr:hypothetical protein C8F04DRAFT_1197756 [Mycena alexandri]